VDEKLGLLHALRPGQSKTFSLEFGPVTSEREVRAIKALKRGVRSKLVENYLDFTKKPR
jgi:hypothetical protein